MEKTKFDIYKFISGRPLSWSAISSFEYDPEQWYESYILGKRQSSKEMTFGSTVGKRIETDPTYIPEIIRYSKMEHPFNVVFGKIKLIGFADSFCDKTNKKLLEIKTGKKSWTQKRVDEHGQIDMYLLMNYITNKINPEEVDVTLCWLPTRETGDFQINFIEDMKPQFFKTKRTMTDILKFGARINKTVKSMEKYVLAKVTKV